MRRSQEIRYRSHLTSHFTNYGYVDVCYKKEKKTPNLETSGAFLGDWSAKSERSYGTEPQFSRVRSAAEFRHEEETERGARSRKTSRGIAAEPREIGSAVTRASSSSASLPACSARIIGTPVSIRTFLRGICRRRPRASTFCD